jgi:hypothetical protein
MDVVRKKEMIAELRRQVVAMEGLGPAKADAATAMVPAAIAAAFPQHSFPTGVTHEFISLSPAAAAAASGCVREDAVSGSAAGAKFSLLRCGYSG